MNSGLMHGELVFGKDPVSKLVEDELKEQSISKNDEAVDVEESVPSSSKFTESAEDQLEAEECAASIGGMDKKPSSRVQIRNMPPYLKYKQVKELLSKQELFS